MNQIPAFEQHFVSDTTMLNDDLEALINRTVVPLVNSRLEYEDLHIFMSPDIMAEYTKIHSHAMRNNRGGHVLHTLVTGFGEFRIYGVPKIRRFMYVGTFQEVEAMHRVGIPLRMLANEEHAKLDSAIEEHLLS